MLIMTSSVRPTLIIQMKVSIQFLPLYTPVFIVFMVDSTIWNYLFPSALFVSFPGPCPLNSLASILKQCVVHCRCSINTWMNEWMNISCIVEVTINPEFQMKKKRLKYIFYPPLPPSFLLFLSFFLPFSLFFLFLNGTCCLDCTCNWSKKTAFHLCFFI